MSTDFSVDGEDLLVEGLDLVRGGFSFDFEASDAVEDTTQVVVVDVYDDSTSGIFSVVG